MPSSSGVLAFFWRSATCAGDNTGVAFSSSRVRIGRATGRQYCHQCRQQGSPHNRQDINPPTNVNPLARLGLAIDSANSYCEVQACTS